MIMPFTDSMQFPYPDSSERAFFEKLSAICYAHDICASWSHPERIAANVECHHTNDSRVQCYSYTNPFDNKQHRNELKKGR